MMMVTVITNSGMKSKSVPAGSKVDMCSAGFFLDGSLFVVV